MNTIAKIFLGALFVFLFGVVGVIVLAFLPAGESSYSSTRAAEPSTYRVVYQIHFDNGVSSELMDTCADFSVTYEVPNGTSQKEIEACEPSTEVARHSGESGDFLYLSIQNTAPRNSAARFSCIIQVNGKTVASVESVGWANIASCSGSIP